MIALSNRSLAGLGLALAIAVAALGFVLVQEASDEVVTRFTEYETLLADRIAGEVEAQLRNSSQHILAVAVAASAPSASPTHMLAELQKPPHSGASEPAPAVLVVDEFGRAGSPAPAYRSLRDFAHAAALQWSRNPDNRGSVTVDVWPASSSRVANGQPMLGSFYVATPLWQDGRSGRPYDTRWRGFLAMPIDLGPLGRTGAADGSAAGQPLHLWVMDSAGNVQYQTERPDMEHLNIARVDASCVQCHGSFDYVRKVLAMKRGTMRYELKGRPPKLAAFAPVRFANASWFVVVDAPQTAVTNFVRRNVTTGSLLLALIGTSFGLIGLSLYRGSVRRALAEETSRHWQEQLRVEEGRRHAEALYRTLFEQSPDGVMTIDPVSTRPIAFNESAHRMLGYSRDEFQTVPIADYEPGGGPAGTAARIDAILRDGAADFETVYRTKAGDHRDVDVSVRSMPLDGRTVLHCIARDITARKRAENAWHLLYRQNAVILESVMDGILGLDTDGRHTFVNPSAARMLGHDADALIGQESHAVWHHTRADGAPYRSDQCPIYAAYRDGRVHHVTDDVFWRKDGTAFPVDYTSTPIRDGGRLIGAVVAFRDLTDKKRAEESVRQGEIYFRALIENATDIISVINPDGTVRYMSPSTQRVLGYEPEELESSGVFDRLHPEDAPRA